MARFVFSIQNLLARLDLTGTSDKGTTGISRYYRSDDIFRDLQ